MCKSCVEIDEKIKAHRKRLEATSDDAEIERINRLIYELYGERVRKHKSPEK